MNTTANRAFGQPQTRLVTGAANLVEGRELNQPSDVAVDLSNKILYVADFGNNRVIRYRQPFNQPSDSILADFVIGQTSVSGTSRSPNAGGRSAKSLYFSDGSAVSTVGMRFDSGGNLWIADPGNSRVLRFPASVL